ncbi:MAG: 30S ribosomal protein S20 [Anaerolineae bacterium]|nr:30S ribosomal protein S20 [Anaerolineae bacterium]
MAHHKSALKRIRSSERKHKRNNVFRARARTHIKKVRDYMDQGELDAARQEAEVAIVVLDKAANKGIIHKNNAARRKSRLMKRLQALEAAAKSA